MPNGASKSAGTQLALRIACSCAIQVRHEWRKNKGSKWLRRHLRAVLLAPARVVW